MIFNILLIYTYTIFYLLQDGLRGLVGVQVACSSELFLIQPEGRAQKRRLLYGELRDESQS